MPLTSFPAGISSFGIPVVGAGQIPSSVTGVYYFVDSGSNTFGDGRTPQRPFATLARALQSSVGGRGDVIICAARHQEKLSSATALVINDSTISIIGLGSGINRPTFTLDTANTAKIVIQASNITFQNVRFVANFLNIAKLFDLTVGLASAGSIAGNILTITTLTSGTFNMGNQVIGANVANGTYILNQISGTTGGVGTYTVSVSQTAASAAVTTSAKNFTVDSCDIVDTTASLNFLALVTTNATANNCDGLQLTRNSISLLAASGNVNLFTAGASADRVLITDNYYASLTVAATATSSVIQLGTANLTNFLLLRNIFVLVNAVGMATGYLITGSGTSQSGMIHDNTDFTLANTTYASSLAVTAGTGIRFGINRHSRTADKSSGATLPTPDA